MSERRDLPGDVPDGLDDLDSLAKAYRAELQAEPDAARAARRARVLAAVATEPAAVVEPVPVPVLSTGSGLNPPRRVRPAGWVLLGMLLAALAVWQLRPQGGGSAQPDWRVASNQRTAPPAAPAEAVMAERRDAQPLGEAKVAGNRAPAAKKAEAEPPLGRVAMAPPASVIAPQADRARERVAEPIVSAPDSMAPPVVVAQAAPPPAPAGLSRAPEIASTTAAAPPERMAKQATAARAARPPDLQIASSERAPAVQDVRPAPPPAPAALAAPAKPQTADFGAPLRQAVQSGDLEAVKQAVASGVPVDAADIQGRTALMLAAGRGDATLVNWLLGQGARAQLRDRDGLLAADYADRAEARALAERLRVAQP